MDYNHYNTVINGMCEIMGHYMLYHELNHEHLTMHNDLHLRLEIVHT